MLNLPRIVASGIEVLNTELITFCLENKVKYLPAIHFYKLDFMARALMLLNSGINIIIYCAVSSQFQVISFSHSVVIGDFLGQYKHKGFVSKTPFDVSISYRLVHCENKLKYDFYQSVLFKQI